MIQHMISVILDNIIVDSFLSFFNGKLEVSFWKRKNIIYINNYTFNSPGPLSLANMLVLKILNQ